MDFHNDRGIVKANTERVRGAPIGIPLENLIPTASGLFPAMVLVKTVWRKQYFVLPREGWTPDDYFNHAERLMKKHGITEP
jgi:hypothetical protein